VEQDYIDHFVVDHGDLFRLRVDRDQNGWDWRFHQFKVLRFLEYWQDIAVDVAF
jgi:hypothetical protein